MSRKLEITGRVREALEYCRSQKCDGERATVSIALLKLLARNWNSSAAEVALKAGCSRRHVFNVLRWVRSRKFDRLVLPGRFRYARVLSEKQLDQIKVGLGTRYKCAKDVVVEFDLDLSQIPTVYGLCARRGIYFRAKHDSQGKQPK